MAGLVEFPFWETTPEEAPRFDLAAALRNLGVEGTTAYRSLPPVQHTFTRYRVTLYPQLLTALSRFPVEGLSWHPLEEIPRLSFSAGHRRLLIQSR